MKKAKALHYNKMGFCLFFVIFSLAGKQMLSTRTLQSLNKTVGIFFLKHPDGLLRTIPASSSKAQADSSLHGESLHRITRF